jgi:hypothetical protein
MDVATIDKITRLFIMVRQVVIIIIIIIVFKYNYKQLYSLASHRSALRYACA